MTAPDRRLRGCVKRWPEAETGAYDPRCCRFPKSCSATVYGDETPEAFLEPAEPVQRIVICAFGAAPHPLDDECQDVRDAEPTTWVSTADCAHASMHAHGEDGRCQHAQQAIEPAAPLAHVGDKILRGAAAVPANVVQFVDQRYLRVWSKHPADPAGMWGSASPSVAYDERHLLDDCGPLVVTAVHEPQPATNQTPEEAR